MTSPAGFFPGPRMQIPRTIYTGWRIARSHVQHARSRHSLWFGVDSHGERSASAITGDRMNRYALGFAAALLATSLAARVQPYPADFHTQMIKTNGTSLFVRVGGKGPA